MGLALKAAGIYPPFSLSLSKGFDMLSPNGDLFDCFLLRLV
jgi:hypothetical protein